MQEQRFCKLWPCCAALLLVATGLPAFGQSGAAQPVLHRRGYNQEEIDLGTRSTGRTQLPTDASGDYMLGTGATITLELQPDRLSGFLTRPGNSESDEGTPLTFFFATGRLSGQRLSFTTRQVHGIWFSFEGTVARGSGQTRNQQGFYLLEGQLILHDAFAGTQQARMVSLPSARQSTIG
jgi:hypothetical protein